MSLGKHLDEAVSQMRVASARIDEARARPVTLESLREWLVALTDYSLALNEVHLLNNQSIHEKLHGLAEQSPMKAKL